MQNSAKGDKKLAIPPFEIDGKVKMVDVAQLHPGHKTLFDYDEAFVVYLDVMGFSHKSDGKDIENTLVDFAAPLALSSIRFPNVRFNVFSDCAFAAAPLQSAKDLVSSVRYAFREWISDGILVRGGIAFGGYRETRTVAIRATKGNFTGNIFAGSGVVDSVKLEGEGKGALLFTNKKTASYFYSNFGEPCYQVDKQLLIGWTDDEKILSIFLAMSLWRLSKIIAKGQVTNNSVVEKLINNVKYALNVAVNPLPYCFMLAILKSKFVSPRVKQYIYKLFRINIQQETAKYRELIVAIRRCQDFLLVKSIADLDSSI